MNRVKKNQILHQFHWALSDEELVYDLMHNFDNDDIRYDKDWGLLIPLIQKIVNNHSDDVVSVKQNAFDISENYQLNLEEFLFDFQLVSVLSKDISEVHVKVVELVELLKENELW